MCMDSWTCDRPSTLFWWNRTLDTIHGSCDSQQCLDELDDWFGDMVWDCVPLSPEEVEVFKVLKA